MSIAHEVSASARCPRSCRVTHPVDGLRVGLVAVGGLQVVLGLLMALDPSILLGPLEGSGDHYVRDLATIELPLGLALLTAARLKAWRVPILALTAVHWALLALSHLLGLRGTVPAMIDVVALAIGAGLLTWLLALAIRAERWG